LEWSWNKLLKQTEIQNVELNVEIPEIEEYYSTFRDFDEKNIN
jgi:hypothetical protein